MVKLTNPNRTIELPEATGVFRNSDLALGEIGKSTKDAPFAYGVRHLLSTFEVGAKVIVPLSSDYLTDWECFEVFENPNFQAAQSDVDETTINAVNRNRGIIAH